MSFDLGDTPKPQRYELTPLPATLPILEMIGKSPEMVHIPAAEGKEPFSLLKTPAYVLIDHGRSSVSFDQGFQPREKALPPNLYAIRLLQINNDPERSAFLTLPAGFNDKDDTYNKILAEELEKQGFDPGLLREIASPKNFVDAFGWVTSYWERRMHHALSDPNFLFTATHPESHLVPQTKPITLESGYSTTTERLTLIKGDEKRVTNYVDIYGNDKLPTGFYFISDRISEKLDPLSTTLLEKIAAANRA